MADLSTARTRLALTATPGQPWGTFGASEPVGGRPSYGQFSRLTPAGVPGRVYGSFAGKAESSSQLFVQPVALSPSLTIGDLTDVEAQVEFGLFPALNLSAQVFATRNHAMSLAPSLLLAATVSSSSITRNVAMPLAPSLTLTTNVQRPQTASVSLVPSLTLSATVDGSLVENLASVDIVPDLTLAATVYNLTPSPSVSLVPSLTLETQVGRIASEITVSVPMTLGPALVLSATVNEGGDVDEIEFSARTFYAIEFEVV
jgi:hypothetical protein